MTAENSRGNQDALSANLMSKLDRESGEKEEENGSANEVWRRSACSV